MAISGYARGHNVKWVTRCQARGADLIDRYSSRTEHLQNPTDHHQRESQGWKAFFTGEAQAACRGKFCGSKLTPFFHIVKLIAAILRASVRRAIVGRIPLSTRAT